MAVRSEAPPVLNLRAHHLLCIQNYRGHGYSFSFDEKMREVIAALQSDSGETVRLIEGTDDLCAVCPHSRGSSCESVTPSLFDSRVFAHTGFVPGETFVWKLGKGTSAQPSAGFPEHTPEVPVMTKSLLKKCCCGCSWMDLCMEILS